MLKRKGAIMHDSKESYLKPAQPPARHAPMKARRPKLGLFGWLSPDDHGDRPARTSQAGRGYRW
jgi:hypothetical protein